MKVKSSLWLMVFLAAFALCIFKLTHPMILEYFGTSPGTMVQLQTSHVPTDEDVYFYSAIYPKVVRKEITGLTGEDPGELRPMFFPGFGNPHRVLAG